MNSFLCKTIIILVNVNVPKILQSIFNRRRTMNIFFLKKLPFHVRMFVLRLVRFCCCTCVFFCVMVKSFKAVMCARLDMYCTQRDG